MSGAGGVAGGGATAGAAQSGTSGVGSGGAAGVMAGTSGAGTSGTGGGPGGAAGSGGAISGTGGMGGTLAGASGSGAQGGAGSGGSGGGKSGCTGGKVVHFVYFVESDQTYSETLRADVERQAFAFQNYWFGQLGRTFYLSEPVVEVIRGDHPAPGTSIRRTASKTIRAGIGSET